MSSKPDSWLPLYVADYQADTTRLTTEQHGAYLLIIMDYWRNGPPPDRDNVLAQITKLSPAKWKAHRPVLAEKFQIAGGVWRHKRIEAEIARAQRKSEMARDAAYRRHGKETPADADAQADGHATADANAHANGDAGRHAERLPKGCSSPSPSPSPDSLPPQSPSHSPPPSAASARGLLSKALRDKGIKGVTPSTPELDAWVTAGISLETVLEAVTLARDKKPEPEQIPFGYIVPIVEQLTTPPKARVNGHHAGRPWFIDSWPAIVRKGAEKGISEDAYGTSPEFKRAVLQAYGITAEQISKAESDWKQPA